MTGTTTFVSLLLHEFEIYTAEKKHDNSDTSKFRFWKEFFRFGCLNIVNLKKTRLIKRRTNSKDFCDEKN